MAKFVPLSEAEKNNDASFFTSLGAGIVSGLIKTVEGVVSLGAELVDLGADSNTVADVERYLQSSGKDMENIPRSKKTAFGKDKEESKNENDPY